MSENNKGIIAWFVNNPVASNLLVCLILLAGVLSAFSVERELLPVPTSRTVLITASYPSASPQEVAEAVTIKIEDSIENLTNIKKIQSYTSIGTSSVVLELEQGSDIDLVLEEVKTQVDSITTFPKEVENISVRKTKPIEFALQLQLYGSLEEAQAKKLAEEIKRELLTKTIVKKVDILGARDYEVSINVSEEQLQKYKITLKQVAARIRAESVNLPVGGIKSASGNILIRVEGQAYRQQDFENIVLLTTESGAVVRVMDVAKVSDGYVDTLQKGLFDGRYSLGIAVSAVGSQDAIDVAKAAKDYAREKQSSLPQGVYLTEWLDTTYYLESRMNTMISNLIYGALLVFLLLVLFMDLKMAFWVVAGIPVSMAGAFILMQMGFANVTLNMVSMFGFIMVVGIVIDDSIVVAESVDDEIRKSGFGAESVIRGTKRVATPAIFGILTTIAAFSPMLFVGGMKHAYLLSIGFVVCACLVFSLMESKWVLPSHLMINQKGIMRFFHSRHQHALQQWMNKKLKEWIQETYLPFVSRAVEKRYVTLAIFIALLMVTFGAMKGGIIRYELLPAEPNDFITVRYSVAQGASEEEIMLAQSKIEEALYVMEKAYQKEFATEGKLVSHLFTYGGTMMLLELTKAETREINSFEIAERWRKQVGEIEGAVVDISGAKTTGSRDMSFLLVGADKKELEVAATELLEELKVFEGLSSQSHSIAKRRLEYILKLRPRAVALELTLADIGLQVKDGFYGAEVQRIQRDNEEITVMVRYPQDRMRSIADLESMHIRLPDGRFMQLKELADIEFVWAESNIVRINGENAVYVNAKVDRSVADPRKISNTVINEIMPALFKKYPGVSYRTDGVSYEEQETEKEIRNYMVIVILVIYILLAVPLKSYTQPLIIMSAIPFGFVGAAWGHWLLGYPISVMSLFGLIALSGIIVNDTLVLIDFVNSSVQEEGLDYKTASIKGGGLRFRAIMLTSVTTFVGDLPMILESSLEAANMIPMAISLGVGIIFATAIILVLVPCLYLVLEDIKSFFERTNSQASFNT